MSSSTSTDTAAGTMFPEDDAAFLTWLRDEAPLVPSMLLAHSVAARLKALPSLLQETKIFVVRNATLEPFVTFLAYHCGRVGLRPVVEFSGYGDWATLASNPPNSPYRWRPDFFLVFLQVQDLSPVLADRFPSLSEKEVDREVAMVEEQITAIVDTLRQNSRAQILVADFFAVGHEGVGSLDGSLPDGYRSQISRLNAKLRDMAAGKTGVSVFGFSSTVARLGIQNILDRRSELTSRLPFTSTGLDGFSLDLARTIYPRAMSSKKCLVLDLDNTLWGGILGEDGPNGIEIGPDYPGNMFANFQREILRLYDRGALLAICSKNDESDVADVFQQHPDMVLRSEHFVAKKINWRNKADNLLEISRELNIGIDSLVFLDDNPVERASVRQHQPTVTVPELPKSPLEYADFLRALPWFEIASLTAEDRMRSAMYHSNVSRECMKQQSKTLDDFLRGLEMRLKIGDLDDFSAARLAQLHLKTNQFNLTTERHDEEALRQLSNLGGVRVLWLQLEDRFGNSGIIGAAILTRLGEPTAEINSLLLSCRILGRGIETALMSVVVRLAREAGSDVLQGKYVPSPRNSPCAGYLADHQFSLHEELADGSQIFHARLSDVHILTPEFIDVEIEEIQQESS